MKTRPYHPPPPETLRLVHSDPAFLVVSKPNGLLSVPGRGPDKSACAVSYLEAWSGRILVVHRLDMDTSGLLVFARTPEAQRALSVQFQTRQVRKEYSAVVAGQPAEDQGTITLPIARYSLDRPKRHVAADGQDAVTRWRVVARTGQSARLSLQPETGRSHQLRLHLREIGHPILGDPLYSDSNRTRRLMLHAARLEFQHPDHGGLCRFEDPAAF